MMRDRLFGRQILCAMISMSDAVSEVKLAFRHELCNLTIGKNHDTIYSCSDRAQFQLSIFSTFQIASHGADAIPLFGEPEQMV